uniref:Venom phosphodiesterase 2 n=1 Tax=Toxocara canis TaxID=6265 RepID=A0A183USX0_TOXCA
LLVLSIAMVFVVIFHNQIFAKLDEHSKNLKTGKLNDSKCDLQICTRSFSKPPLLIVSLDGFRASYLQRGITPAIQRLFDCGTQSKFVMPVFPSKTFPNHYTIATGLYPASHGIVDNSFQDANLPVVHFKKSAKTAGWYLGEPIWNTVQKYGMKSAVYFWPGSEAPVNGKRPNYFMNYDGSVPFTQRIDKAIEWLNMPEDERPSLVMVYMEEPDSAGHMAGAESQQVRTASITVDGMINYLTRRLINEGLIGCINVIILSDHGMQTIDPSRAVILKDILEPSFNGSLFDGVVGQISAPNNFDESVEHIIRPLKCHQGQSYLAYKTEHAPMRYHYRGSHRIGDVLIEARPGVLILSSKKYIEWGKRRLGDHGYDNRLPNMRTIFGAYGPSIAEKKLIDEFEIIELYNLFADLLSIHAAPNNGTKGRLNAVLRKPSSIRERTSTVAGLRCTEEVKDGHCHSVCEAAKMNDNKCIAPKAIVSFDLSNGAECYVSLCDSLVYVNNKLGITQMVVTILSGTNSLRKPNKLLALLWLYDRKYELRLHFITIIILSGTWRYVVRLIDNYLEEYGQLTVYFGPVYDVDGNGVRDSDDLIRKNKPSHVFLIVFRCTEAEVSAINLCRKPIFIPFILPIVDDDFNCLDSPEYMFQNTVRIRDIELLTGLQFFTDRNIWSTEEAIMLRTYVTQNLWPY